MAFDLNTLQEKLGNKDITAAVIGLGYVGLPLSYTMFSHGVKVIGLDVDPKKMEVLEKGQSYLDSVSGESVAQAMEKGLFKASDDFSELKDADFIVICVPTPLDSEHKPDLSYVEKTARDIAKYLRPDQIVILESTTYPGTMTEVVVPLLEKESGLKCEEDFHVAFSPEREDPGNKSFSTGIIPKIVGANHPDALDVTVKFYEVFISKVVPVSSMEVAEAAKITENVFRAVNIAFVNELKVIFDRMGIDVWEVIDAAATKPFGYMPFYPGPGIGGHCIPIDPFYLSWKAEQSGQQTRFIELAGEINLSMRDYIVRKLSETFGNADRLDDKKLLVIGVAYKKNVNDQRESPTFPLMKTLLEKGAHVDFHDSYIPAIMPMRQYPEFSGQISVPINQSTLQNYDAVLIITDHDDVDYQLIADESAVVIDTRNALRSRNIYGRAQVVLA